MTSPTGSKSDRRGLTLIEVLVSIVILSSATVAVMQAMARIAYAQTFAEQESRAFLLGASKLAELELATMRGELDRPESGTLFSGAQAYGWDASLASDGTDPYLKTLNLNVHWTYRDREYGQRLATQVRQPKPKQ